MKKKITIKNKLNTKTYFIVEIDNEDWGILDRRTLQSFFLIDEKINFVDEKQEKEIIFAIKKFCWGKLLDFIARRERSVWECEQYLKRNFLHSSLSHELIENAKQKNYLNEIRFCEMYIQSLMRIGKSKIEIKHKLFTRGISDSLLTDFLDKFFTQDKEIEIIKVNIEKAKKKYQKYDSNIARNKIISFMIRKGFQYYHFIDYISDTTI